MKGTILPDALRLAAIGCDSPEWIGGIVLALCGKNVTLDRGQKVVMSMCSVEIAEREARRAASAERKRRQRMNKAGKRGAR